jgi:hypothetical protein
MHRRHRDDDQAGRGFAGDLLDLRDLSQHGHALHLAAAQLGGIVEEADGFIGTGASQVAHERFARTARAEDQDAHRSAVVARKRMFLPRAVEQARRTEQADQRERIQEQHRARDVVQAVVEEQTQADGDHAKQAGLGEVQQIRDAREAPQTAIEADAPEHQALRQEDHDGFRRPQRWQRDRGPGECVTDEREAVPAEPHHCQVVDDHGAARQRRRPIRTPTLHSVHSFTAALLFHATSARASAARSLCTRYTTQ